MVLEKKIHVTNEVGQDIYVMAVPRPGWALADLATDVVLLAAGVTEIKAVATAMELPESIATFADLVQFLKVASALGSGTWSVGARPAAAVRTVVEAVQHHSVKIATGKAANLREEGLLSYLSASGIAALLGAETVSMLVMSADGKLITDFDSGPDESWIVTPDGIHRVAHGTVSAIDSAFATIPWTSTTIRLAPEGVEIGNHLDADQD
ncbi:hypothetical protein [Kitasatospora sp. NPDC059827]|uniref:hypothetical protein n=1 Tax=Kitasatospora sp. NPDC059827 TaxID=3346964 RepID=UPI003647B483